MNILHIISGGEKGGSRKHLLSLASGMKHIEGARCIIVCFLTGALYDEARSLGLDVRLVQQTTRFDMSSIENLRRICKDESIDIVNCHGGRANFAGYLLMRRYKAIYISTIHSDYKDDYRGNAYKTLVFSNINKAVLKSFDYYITVSHSFKDMLIARGFKKEKIYVVYNGIDFSQKINNLDRKEIITSKGLPETSHYVSLVARFHPVKGHKVFLDACSRVLSKFKDVTFILVGDGSIKEELMAYTEGLGIKEKIYFAGFTAPDEYIFLSDFTIVASYTESFPLTILESAMYNRTVVSTEVGGVDRIIENGINGYMVKPGDSASMAEKMLELLNDKNQCEEFGLKLGQRARKCYDLDSFVREYLHIYKSIM